MPARQIRKTSLGRETVSSFNSPPSNCGSPGCRERIFLKVIVALKMPTSASYLDSCGRHRHVL